MFFAARKPKVGDRLVVCDRPEKVVIERIEKEHDGRVKLILDWGEFGKSRVWEHDQGSTWAYFVYVN